MEFEKITYLSGLAATALWCASAFFLAYSGPFAFGIVGVLAVLAQAVAVNSARREGVGRTKGPINRFLERVGK